MFATIFTIFVAIPALMNVIGVDLEDIVMWFTNGGNYNIF